MKIIPRGSVPTIVAPEAYFTGRVLQTRLVEAELPARIRVFLVRFDPGARTAWHTHPLGQTLHVTEGTGLTQTWGGPVQQISVGDTVWIPPGEKHWHGAAPHAAMTHMAIQEALDGVTADWMEKVSDEQYGG